MNFVRIEHFEAFYNHGKHQKPSKNFLKTNNFTIFAILKKNNPTLTFQLAVHHAAARKAEKLATKSSTVT